MNTPAAWRDSHAAQQGFSQCDVSHRFLCACLLRGFSQLLCIDTVHRPQKATVIVRETGDPYGRQGNRVAPFGGSLHAPFGNRIRSTCVRSPMAEGSLAMVVGMLKNV